MLDGLTYQEERYSDIIREALPLLHRHWKEVGSHHDKIPFDPNFDYFFEMDRNGNISLVTCRSHGTLVGYVMQLNGPGMHYKQTLWSTNNVIWVDPAFRSGWIGVKLLIELEKVLRRKKVQLWEMLPRWKFQRERGGMQKILDYLDFEMVGTVHHKWLGD